MHVIFKRFHLYEKREGIFETWRLLASSLPIRAKFSLMAGHLPKNGEFDNNCSQFPDFIFLKWRTFTA